ncbi:PEP-CTERM sorting domain-containing protein [Desulfobacter sp.]|uniref:PEP-CTERM sorting domain-containing protein n=1 Tax=Desulfobacter sp. TaxID=2294 RepID=UPI003D14084A
MIEKTRYSIIATALMLSFFLCSIAFAADTYIYNFQHIKEDGDDTPQLNNGKIGEEQLSFEVSYESDDLVTFTFYNSGTKDSSITDIYFDDNVPLLVFAGDKGSKQTGFEYSQDYDKVTKAGVEFTVGATPQDLSGGGTLDPVFTSNYDYDADDPSAHKGVNPDEWVKLYFKLATNDTKFTNLIAALDDGSFRVGIHVQGFENSGSEAFVNGSRDDDINSGGSEVPEPATLLLLGFGMLSAAGISRKKFF